MERPLRISRRLTSSSQHAPTPQVLEEEQIARTTLRKQAGGIPQDMKLVGVNNVMVGLFDAEHLKETYHESITMKQLTFAHIKDGQQIYADGKPDHITVSIDAKGVQKIERQWHKLVMR